MTSFVIHLERESDYLLKLTTEEAAQLLGIDPQHAFLEDEVAHRLGVEANGSGPLRELLEIRTARKGAQTHRTSIRTYREGS